MSAPHVQSTHGSSHPSRFVDTTQTFDGKGDTQQPCEEKPKFDTPVLSKDESQASDQVQNVQPKSSGIGQDMQVSQVSSIVQDAQESESYQKIVDARQFQVRDKVQEQQISHVDSPQMQRDLRQEAERTDALLLDASERADIGAVFAAMDRARARALDSQMLAQLFDDAGYKNHSLRSHLGVCDLPAFENCILDLMSTSTGASTTRGAFPISAATVLLCVVEQLRQRAMMTQDFKFAQLCKSLSDSLRDREESRRLHQMAVRHEAERETVARAHSIQSMEFNSAWKQTMEEFELQAQRVEEEMVHKFTLEFEGKREKAEASVKRSSKYSRKLIELKQSVDTLARQGKLTEAHVMKHKVIQLEKYERAKIDNDQQVQLANKELAIRQKQRVKLESFRNRIQRGREEHKERWIRGAQNLLQNQRNLVTDLKRKQSQERSRIEVAVKMDLAAITRACGREAKDVARAKVDTGIRKSVGKSSGSTVSTGKSFARSFSEKNFSEKARSAVKIEQLTHSRSSLPSPYVRTN